MPLTIPIPIVERQSSSSPLQEKMDECRERKSTTPPSSPRDVESGSERMDSSQSSRGSSPRGKSSPRSSNSPKWRRQKKIKNWGQKAASNLQAKDAFKELFTKACTALTNSSRELSGLAPARDDAVLTSIKNTWYVQSSLKLIHFLIEYPVNKLSNCPV